MSQQKKSDPRGNFTIRLSEAERELFERRAAAAGRKPSDFGRAALLGGTVTVAAVTPPVERHRLAATALAEQLRRIGVNLNQWVRRMNETDTLPPPEARIALLEIRALVRQAREL